MYCICAPFDALNALWCSVVLLTGQRWAGCWVEGKPQWVQPLVEAGSEAAAGLKQEEAANMTHAVAAAQMAQEVRV
jgi:uncharacterized membrane protein